MPKAKKMTSAKATKTAAVKTPKSKAQSAAEPKNNKTTQMVDLLRREKGATIDELVAFTGWNTNSVRGFLSGTIGKKMGLKLDSTKSDDGMRKYQIAS